jgi:hypothetical protein
MVRGIGARWIGVVALLLAVASGSCGHDQAATATAQTLTITPSVLRPEESFTISLTPSAIQAEKGGSAVSGFHALLERRVGGKWTPFYTLWVPAAPGGEPRFTLGPPPGGPTIAIGIPDPAHFQVPPVPPGTYRITRDYVYKAPSDAPSEFISGAGTIQVVH